MTNLISNIFNICYSAAAMLLDSPIGDYIGQGDPPPNGCQAPDAWFIVAMVLGPLLLVGLVFVVIKVVREKRSDSLAERDLIDQKNDEIKRLRQENKALKLDASQTANNNNMAVDETADATSNEELGMTNDEL